MLNLLTVLQAVPEAWRHLLGLYEDLRKCIIVAEGKGKPAFLMAGAGRREGGGAIHF